MKIFRYVLLFYTIAFHLYLSSFLGCIFFTFVSHVYLCTFDSKFKVTVATEVCGQSVSGGQYKYKYK